MSEVRLWKWEDNAEVILSWSNEDDFIRVVVTSNDRVIFNEPLSKLEGYRTFQTFFNEMGVEIKINGIRYRFIGAKESPATLGAAFLYPTILISIITTYSASSQEKHLGLDELRQAAIDRNVPVERSTYPRTIFLAILTGIMITLFIVGIRNIIGI